MFNIVVKKYGGPENLIYEEKKPSQIKPNAIRIKVKSIGVNFADTLIIRGKYQERPRPPFSPGLEVSGILSEIDKSEIKFKVVDKVCNYEIWGLSNRGYCSSGKYLLCSQGNAAIACWWFSSSLRHSL